MTGMEWTLEIVLVALLGGTLVQALRLERALGVLKRDRAALEAAVHGFNLSTNQAESGIQSLRAAADGAGRHLDAQLAKSQALKEDLDFLSERGEKLADRMERLIRTARPMAPERTAPETAAAIALDRPASPRAVPERPALEPALSQHAPSQHAPSQYAPSAHDDAPLGSQQERDRLLQALRLAR